MKRFLLFVVFVLSVSFIFSQNELYRNYEANSFNQTDSNLFLDTIIGSADFGSFSNPNSREIIWNWDSIVIFNTNNDFFKRKFQNCDEQGRPLERIFQEFKDSTWSVYWRFIFEYDSVGNRTIKRGERWKNNNWQYAWRYRYVYNNIGKLHRIIVETWKNGEWVMEEGGALYTYDSNGYLVEYGHLDYRNLYTYDSDGNRYSDELQMFVMGQGDVPIEKHTYSYYPDGKLYMDTLLGWNYGWFLQKRYTYTYDNNENLLLYSTQDYQGNGSWFTYSKDTCIYDSNNNLITKLTKTWNTILSDFSENNKQQYTYDAYGNSITGMNLQYYYSWDPVFSNIPVYSEHKKIWSIYGYRYEASFVSFTIVGLSNTKGLSDNLNLFPNPAQDVITFKLNERNSSQEVQVKIYNLLGQVVINKSLMSGSSIDISGLPSGTYFLQVISGEKRAMEKFLKR